MFDADSEVSPRTVAAHVLDDGNEVSGPNIAAAQSGRAAEETRHVIQFRIAGRARDGVGECGLHFAEQGIGLHHRHIETLDDGNGFAMPQRFHDFDRWIRPPACDMQQADFDSHIFADPVDHCFGGFDHAAGTDNRILRIVQPVGHNHVILASRQAGVFVHYPLQRGQHAVVPFSLRDLSFHVTVLVLNDAGHQRQTRIKQRTSALGRTPDKLLHQFEFRQADVFYRVCGEKSVLDIQKRSLGFLGSAPGNQSKITGLLRVPRQKHPPAAIGYAVHVIVSGMHIQ